MALGGLLGFRVYGLGFFAFGFGAGGASFMGLQGLLEFQGPGSKTLNPLKI